MPAQVPHHRTEYQNEITDDEHKSTDQARLKSSYCYPSPPRRPYAQLYYSETEQSQPSLPSEPTIKDEETSATGGAYASKPAAVNGEELALPQQMQTRTTSKRRKLRVQGSAVGSSASAATWNALDVNAAELLVNFSVKVKPSKGDDGEGDSDDSSTGRSAVSKDDTKSRPRFSASIASLLCDDEAPRKKCRRS
ncbi:hypothetical protein SEUCBS140593_000616 [Sporothrix eucalyptigena]|uniref:Uncharacterized protein n=1 Tax=Sporothrix eucalyptigena TaxID=1812306 RepID=A0ABP0ARB7_9PEZI